MPPDRSTAWNSAATATMPAERPQSGELAPLDALVKGALAEALVELPGVAGLAGGALGGEQSALDTLGRGFVRRDPVAGLDPLPEGGDSAIFSTAAIASGREPGQHWPDLNAFRLSEDFPGGAFDPLRVAERAGRNFLPALMFPESPPASLVPKLPSAPVVGQPCGGAVVDGVRAVACLRSATRGDRESFRAAVRRRAAAVARRGAGERRQAFGRAAARAATGFPRARPAGPRPAAGLARQRGDDPEAARGDRSDHALLRARQFERASRCP